MVDWRSGQTETHVTLRQSVENPSSLGSRRHQANAPDHFTEYLVNAPPAWLSEFGPSAA